MGLILIAIAMIYKGVDAITTLLLAHSFREREREKKERERERERESESEREREQERERERERSYTEFAMIYK